MITFTRILLVAFAIGCVGGSSGGNGGGGGGGGDGGGGGGGGDGGGGGGGDGGGGGGGDGGTVATGCDPRAASTIRLTRVGGDYTRPVFVTSPAGDSRVFVVEQGGDIKVIGGSTFADHSALVDAGFSGPDNEWGLLGMAFHPNFASNGLYYISYTSGGTVNVDEVDGGSRSNLLSVTNDTSHHYGGMLAFGSDGTLHASIGDADSGQSRDTGSDYGKIHAINVTSGAATNKAIGLRNPWRFSFDRSTGDLYIGDVGGAYDEINIVPSGMAGLDFGWPQCDGPQTCGSSQQPIYPTQEGRAMIGGYVYRGSAISGLQGAYVFTDYENGWVRSFRWCGSGTDIGDEHEYSVSTGVISSMGEDSAGELYIVEHIPGRIWKITP